MFGLGRQLLSPRIQGITVPGPLVSPRQDTTFRITGKTCPSEPSSPLVVRSSIKRESPQATPKSARRKVMNALPLSVEMLQGIIHPDLIPTEGSSILSGEEHLLIPPALEGCNVLVLGCKSGLESYTCSGLVGPTGSVIGVDSNEKEIEKANQFIDYHVRLFNYKEPNIKFIATPLGDLSPISSESIDVIVSACSLNSHEEKHQIFKECHRVLKKGGEIYFSDVLSSKRPNTDGIIKKGDNNMYETIYKEDFRRLMNKAGFEDVRMVAREDITDAFVAATKITSSNIQFHLNTIRAFKLESMEDRRENYGQVATYLGSPHQGLHLPFCLDDDNVFYVGKTARVDGNTAEILSNTRYKTMFEVTPKGVHEGLFCL